MFYFKSNLTKPWVQTADFDFQHGDDRLIAAGCPVCKSQASVPVGEGGCTVQMSACLTVSQQTLIT